ncbi:GDP-mannose 4,6-dehydratase [Patescibacteria group bacterium]|nr:GDP-mannose 4,6-dehydratase [Patescibacteria group bacterium]
MLVAEKEGVVGIDNLNDYYDVRLKEYRLTKIPKSSFVFLKADIEKKEELEEIFRENEIGAVIHLAARAGVRYSSENPAIYTTTNVLGTLNILELMRRFKVPKLIMASTSSLYAGQKMPFREDGVTDQPISVYAATKKAAEELAYTYHYLFGIDVSVLRYFTVYGPMGRPDMALFKFTQKIFKGEEIEIYGDGKQKRDMTFIDDIARGTMLGLKKVGFEIINLGKGDGEMTVLNMVELIEKYSGKKAKVRFMPGFKEDMEATAADNRKAKELLGWQPAHRP